MIGPMIKLYSRHVSRCRHRGDRDHLRCDCPVWVQGRIRGQQVRRSTKEHSERLAWNVVNDWIEHGLPEDEKSQDEISIAQAKTEFIASCKAKGNKESTLVYQRKLVQDLVDFCKDKNLWKLKDVDAAEVGRFRDSWTQGSAMRAKKQKVLTQLFKWATVRKLIAENPTLGLETIKIKRRKTDPFTKDEMRAILRALSDYQGDQEALRVEVFTLRYTGFRGEDAACLPTDALDGDHIKVETGKTDEVVWILAPVAAAALRSIKPKTKDYFFWTGESARATARGVLYRKMKRLFKLAGIKNAHPHRFRDTFACELLQQGVPIKDVSMMLGHQSVVVTEKYYSKWVRGRQEALDAQVTRAMGADQIAKEAVAWYGSGTQGASAEIPVDYKEVVMVPRVEERPGTVKSE